MTRRYRDLLAGLRAWNFRRVERRRLHRETLAALVADDAAIMEALVRIADQALAHRGALEQEGAERGSAEQRIELAVAAAGARIAEVDAAVRAEGERARTETGALRELLARLEPSLAAISTAVEALVADAAVREARARAQGRAAGEAAERDVAGGDAARRHPDLAAVEARLSPEPSAIEAGIKGLNDRLAPELVALETRLGERLGLLEERLRRQAIGGGIPEGREPDAWPILSTARDALVEPELDLIAHLSPVLEPRIAVDVGAHHGRFSEALLGLGFQVHALEPNPAAREVLLRRLAGRGGLTVHPVAAGFDEGEAELGLVANPDGQYADPTLFASLSGLPLPPGLVRAGSIRVPVRRLDLLLREHHLPVPSVVKVDAEGFDLEVLRGLGDLRPALLLAEFWDDALPFSAAGARNRLPDLVAHARRQGAPWHLVVFRRWGDDRPAFYAGLSDSPERSWGNVLFFTEHSLYERARTFLAGTIPEARFVPRRAAS